MTAHEREVIYYGLGVISGLVISMAVLVMSMAVAHGG